jgi:hypothetical protein
MVWRETYSQKRRYRHTAARSLVDSQICTRRRLSLKRAHMHRPLRICTLPFQPLQLTTCSGTSCLYKAAAPITMQAPDELIETINFWQIIGQGDSAITSNWSLIPGMWEVHRTRLRSDLRCPELPQRFIIALITYCNIWKRDERVTHMVLSHSCV